MSELIENFLDGKGPGKPGDAARHGLKGKSAGELRNIRSSSKSSPRRKQLAHWMLNMHHNESVQEGLKNPKDNPCWKGYKPVGTKMKDDKEVPNCVLPVKESLCTFKDFINEAEGEGRKVKLGKPFLTPGGPKKRAVYVKNPETGNVKKVNFGDPNMRIKKSNPARRRSFRARHNCDNPGPRTKARYWSCKAW